MTPKEIFLETLKPDGKPERLLKQYEALCFLKNDPIRNYIYKGRNIPGQTTVDPWGTTHVFLKGAPSSAPYVTEKNKVCPDITRWREYVHAPDLEAHCSEGWEACLEESKKACGDDRLLFGFMGIGLFEQLHFLMGFEDALINFKKHPQEMHELIDYILDYRMTYLEMLIDKTHPEGIFSHDDWGTVSYLFMRPQMWRDFFKEPYRKFYGYIRSKGMIAIHHADSYLMPIVKDMPEIGIQVWQGVLPQNDIPALQAELNGSMVLMGGIGGEIDREDSTEEEIRPYVRSALEKYAPGGHYIPSITYGAGGTIYKHVDPVINDEIEQYNQKHFNI